MGVIHRIKKTFSVSIDSLLDEVENQQGVVAAMIRDVERGATRVRAHRLACERAVAALDQKHTHLTSEVNLWRQRTRRLADDRDKALECLRRARRAEEQQTDLARQLAEQQKLLECITEDERAIEDKLGDLRRRHASLSSRETRTLAECGEPDLTDLDQVFDRWEAKLEGREARVCARTQAVDGFARALSRDEEDAELNAELDRVLAGGDL